MRKKLQITTIDFKNNGTKIIYGYIYDKELSRYLDSNKPFFVEYNQKVSNVPISIAIIPFLANIVPVAWFAGFDIVVDEIDVNFYNSLINFKSELTKYYPHLALVESNIIFNKLVETKYDSNIVNKNAMLFSGGVDAYATYFRNNKVNLDLITINGADIELKNVNLWNELINYIENEKIIQDENKYYIQSNFREFITFEVDKLLLNYGWWGKVQHGIALTCLTAPLAYLNNYERLYISSSYTRKDNYKFVVWGSMPETDNLIKWGATSVIHDAEELTRQEKLELIYQSTSTKDEELNIRVCYSDLKTEVNCSVCEKCLRTIFGLMVIGANPNNYGFKVNKSVYKLISKHSLKKYSSEGNQLFWREIYQTATESNVFYYFEDKQLEDDIYNKIISQLKISTFTEIQRVSSIKKYKMSFMSTFPRLFEIYLKIRRKI